MHILHICNCMPFFHPWMFFMFTLMNILFILLWEWAIVHCWVSHKLSLHVFFETLFQVINNCLLFCWDFPGGTSGKYSACPYRICKRHRFNQYLSREDPLEEEMANPLQYSCLENSVDRVAWWATVYEDSKSQTWLRDWTQTHFFLDKLFIEV